MQKLTEEQRRHWSTIGYIKLEGALKPDAVAYLSGQLAGSGKQATLMRVCFSLNSFSTKRARDICAAC